MLAWQSAHPHVPGALERGGEAARAVTEAHNVSAVGRIIDAGGAGTLTHAPGRSRRRRRRSTKRWSSPRRRARCSAWRRCGLLARRPRGWTAIGSGPSSRRARVYDLALRHRHAWHTAELTFWRRRAGERVALPAWAAAPFALQLRAATGVGPPRPGASSAVRWSTPARWRTATPPHRWKRWRSSIGRARGRRRTPCASACAPRACGGSRAGRAPPRGPIPFGLTSREMEILQAVAAGLSNAQIGARLHISAKTVDHHVSAILTKLDVPTRQEAARVSRQWQTGGQHGEAPAQNRRRSRCRVRVAGVGSPGRQ